MTAYEILMTIATWVAFALSVLNVAVKIVSWYRNRLTEKKFTCYAIAVQPITDKKDYYNFMVKIVNTINKTLYVSSIEFVFEGYSRLPISINIMSGLYTAKSEPIKDIPVMPYESKTLCCRVRVDEPLTVETPFQILLYTTRRAKPLQYASRVRNSSKTSSVE